VTGVQTCALPISRSRPPPARRAVDGDHVHQLKLANGRAPSIMPRDMTVYHKTQSKPAGAP